MSALRSRYNVVFLNLGADRPTFHELGGELRRGTGDNDGLTSLTTQCGRVWATWNSPDGVHRLGEVLPRKHATKFARPCSTCSKAHTQGAA
jgi:hypothetical protein